MTVEVTKGQCTISKLKIIRDTVYVPSFIHIYVLCCSAIKHLLMLAMKYLVLMSARLHLLFSIAVVFYCIKMENIGIVKWHVKQCGRQFCLNIIEYACKTVANIENI